MDYFYKTFYGVFSHFSSLTVFIAIQRSIKIHPTISFYGPERKYDRFAFTSTLLPNII